MRSSLDKTEMQLYRSLFVLMKKQVSAMYAGKLGLWGQWRERVREEKVEKLIQTIDEHKISKGITNPQRDVAKDLEFIDQDQADWGDISSEVLEFVGWYG